METLVDARIEPIGTTKIQSDAKPSEFFEGLGAFVTFEPEQKGDWQRIDAVIVTPEETRALMELTKLFADPTKFSAATEVVQYVEEQVGTVDWTKIARRYEKLTNGH